MASLVCVQRNAKNTSKHRHGTGSVGKDIAVANSYTYSAISALSALADAVRHRRSPPAVALFLEAVRPRQRHSRRMGLRVAFKKFGAPKGPYCNMPAILADCDYEKDILFNLFVLVSCLALPDDDGLLFVSSGFVVIMITVMVGCFPTRYTSGLLSNYFRKHHSLLVACVMSSKADTNGESRS